ncbi:MAG: cytochrome C, partial [Acidimicrobiia bacterium]|nr:cytochrome C [Acidimicrobiia bacterium]
MFARSHTPLWRRRSVILAIASLAVLSLIFTSCSSDDSAAGDGSYGVIIEERGFTDADVAAALKTYMPSGEHDPYIMFASGGHSGQIFVIGVPSMRILKELAVFTPEPWQGWGFGNEGTMEVLDAGNVGGNEIRWADTHHPALSETNGDYDGEFVFINDKANARVAVIDLRDFETKQIIKNPIAINDHGGTKVTPNTEWVVQGGQYATPHGWEFSPTANYDTD